MTTYRYKGWTIERGAYSGTTDDRIDRWYIQSPADQASDTVDRRGSGFPTLDAAREAIRQAIAEESQ